MRKAISVLTIVLFCGISYGQNQLTEKKFKNLCDSSGLQFTMPEGYKIIGVRKNRDLVYSFAVINSSENELNDIINIGK